MAESAMVAVELVAADEVAAVVDEAEMGVMKTAVAAARAMCC